MSSTAGPTPQRVLYVSKPWRTPSYTYRVENQIEALRAVGIDAGWVALADAPASADAADLIIVFREPWSPLVKQLHERCRASGIPMGADIDDLLFDPAVLTPENADFLRMLDDANRATWVADAERYQDLLRRADFAIVSTSPLAGAAQEMGIKARVLPNGIGQWMIDHAEAAMAARSTYEDRWLRIGYASGTMTHQRDFGTISGALADVLESNPAAMLTVVGHLGLEEFPELVRFGGRVETRGPVPHEQLFEEYARFDINIAPLEVGNPFCEAKSPIKYLEAGLVEVPTIAAATAPFRQAIEGSRTGLLAATPAEWRSCLELLIDSPNERTRLGRLARAHVSTAFGLHAQGARARATMGSISSDLAAATPNG